MYVLDSHLHAEAGFPAKFERGTHKDIGTVAHSCHPLYYGFTHCYITLVENTVALIDMCFSLEIGEYENDLLIIRNLELQDQFFLI